DGLGAVARLEDGVAELLEEEPRRPPDRGVVLGEEDRLRPARRRRLRLGSARRSRGGEEREVDPERRAASGLARDVDRAAVPSHDPVDDREPEPGAATDLLRREERLED